jgi:hypothetical protein
VPEPTIEELLDQFFERNFAEIQADRGHALAPQVRDTALMQVRLYWRRLSQIAKRVTDTEVRLLLGGQHTPSGRPFTIEGIVDIVREEERVTLYDVKTHDADFVRANTDQYEGQLNLYAHVWATLYAEALHETAIICTAFPESVRQALSSGDTNRESEAIFAWDPIVPLPFSLALVEQTVAEFGEVVDAIEAHRFPPRGVETLRRPEPGRRARFATMVCRNCDARFSCSSYREYARGSNNTAETAIAQYLVDYGDDSEREEFTSASLDSTSITSDSDLP